MTEIDSFSQCIDNIENAYEFMLVYAARGLDEEADNESPSIRDLLKSLSESLENINSVAIKRIETLSTKETKYLINFLEVLYEDANKAKISVDLILSSPLISSQLVDNLNSSIHLRALLTSLFVIDEAINSFNKIK
jgi:hypothetical protein